MTVKAHTNAQPMRHPIAYRKSTSSQPRELDSYVRDGVRYLDTQSLKLSFHLPEKTRRPLVILLIIAAVIGGILIFVICDNTINAPAKQAAAIEENLERDVPLDLPDLISLAGLGDEEVLTSLQDTGATFYERSSLGTTEEGGFDIVKLADDVTLADATSMCTTGISKLSAPDAVELLNGSWEFAISHDEGKTDMYVSYADFYAMSLENAVQSGIDNAGLGDLEVLESGTDEAGNTYASGTYETDDATYTWRVSALPLSDMYSISGLPDNSCFVGIRFDNESGEGAAGDEDEDYGYGYDYGYSYDEDEDEDYGYGYDYGYSYDEDEDYGYGYNYGYGYDEDEDEDY